jgi:hypothetical protein
VKAPRESPLLMILNGLIYNAACVILAVNAVMLVAILATATWGNLKYLPGHLLVGLAALVIAGSCREDYLWWRSTNEKGTK